MYLQLLCIKKLKSELTLLLYVLLLLIIIMYYYQYIYVKIISHSSVKIFFRIKFYYF